ncbi:MAG: inositol monophosphatase family protein [Gemmatimonadaceae bacterium]
MGRREGRRRLSRHRAALGPRGSTRPRARSSEQDSPSSTPELIERYQRQFGHVMRETSGVRRAGSAALDLADVAAGRFDAFWELRLSPWDIAAGILLVREAGGIVTDPTGAPATEASIGLVAGNPAMHAWLLDIVRSA